MRLGASHLSGKRGRTQNRSRMVSIDFQGELLFRTPAPPNDAMKIFAADEMDQEGWLYEQHLNAIKSSKHKVNERLIEFIERKRNLDASLQMILDTSKGRLESPRDPDEYSIGRAV